MPANWTRTQRVERADGSILNPSAKISLDMTYFEDSGQSYYAWQMLGSIFIAKMNPADPTRLTSDLTSPSAWTKLNYPIQKSGIFNGQWQLGTGHGMWSQDEDANLLYVFHARTDHNGLSGRDTLVRRVHFAADGLPIFDMEADEEVAPDNRAVNVTIHVGAHISAEVSRQTLSR